MNKGIYIALSGAVLRQLQMDIISQNLANADTTGYKRDKVSFNDYLVPRDLVSPEPEFKAMSYHSPLITDYSEGNLVKTNNAFDIAIEGKGFIALEGDRYTRRGDLKRDKDGYLTTYHGIKVMGDKGPIRLPEGAVEISPSGSISVNKVEVDVIKIVDFTNNQSLSKAGESIFISTEQALKANAEVKQGYLETSNVSVIKEMVTMIQALREYETYQKAIQTFDEAAAKINNEMGRL